MLKKRELKILRKIGNCTKQMTNLGKKYPTNKKTNLNRNDQNLN